ncbi:MAG: glutathione S-transferase [Pseudohongiellaceae bacterium]
MIRIYHAPRTRSIRVIWLCEELGLPYERIPVDFAASYRFSPEWMAKNPVGKVPVMEDGDLSMFESGAMVQYLLDRYGKGRLQPQAGTAEHAIYLQWSWFGEATYARPLGELVNHRRVFGKDNEIEAVVKDMKDRVWLCVQALDVSLQGKDYLLGNDFSAADIMNGYSLMLTDWLLAREYPAAVGAYWQRLKSRPAYQIAVS